MNLLTDIYDTTYRLVISSLNLVLLTTDCVSMKTKIVEVNFIRYFSVQALTKW